MGQSNPLVKMTVSKYTPEEKRIWWERKAEEVKKKQDENRKKQQEAKESRKREKTKPCFEFLESGTCAWGEKCKYSHGVPAAIDPVRYPRVLTRSVRIFLVL
jgi:hypothetical protein